MSYQGPQMHFMLSAWRKTLAGFLQSAPLAALTSQCLWSSGPSAFQATQQHSSSSYIIKLAQKPFVKHSASATIEDDKVFFLLQSLHSVVRGVPSTGLPSLSAISSSSSVTGNILGSQIVWQHGPQNCRFLWEDRLWFWHRVSLHNGARSCEGTQRFDAWA